MKSKFIFATISFLVTARLFAFDFNLEKPLSKSISVFQGFGGITSIHLSIIEGSPQTVNMSAPNLPAGVQVLFSPKDIPFDREGGHVPYTSTATVRIITSASTPAGTHTITLTGTGGGITRETSLILKVSPLTAKGKIYYVSTTGNNSNSGVSPSQAFRTIQRGADSAKPGDVIVVKAGEYRERVTMKTSGLVGNPITFLGEPGAIINAAEKITGWQLAPEIGTGVYKKEIATMPFEPKAMTWKGKFCVWMSDGGQGLEMGSFRELITMPANLYTVPSWGCGDTPDSWNKVGALGYSENGWTYVRVATDQDPDVAGVEYAPYGGSIDITRKQYITVNGFTVKNGWSQVMIRNTSVGNIIEHNTLLGGTAGVWVERSLQNQIRNNEITMNFYYEELGHSMNTSQTDCFMYLFLRKYSTNAKHWGIYLEQGDETQVYENHIFKCFAGIETEGANNIRIYRNYIHHIQAYCYETHGLGADTTWIHDNLFYEASHMFRIDAIPNSATFFYYRNRLGTLTQRGTVVPGAHYMGSELGGDVNWLCDTDAKIYFYHNSMNGGNITWTSHCADPANSFAVCQGGLPNLWMINNIFSNWDSWWYYSNYWFGQQRFHIEYNWCGGNYRDLFKDWLTSPTNMIRQNLRMWDDFNPSFLPNAESKQRGLDLSVPWKLYNVQHPALPGMTPGYFSGNRPDLGAVQYEAPSIKKDEAGALTSNTQQFLQAFDRAKGAFSIRYSLIQDGDMELGIYDSFGRSIRTLEKGIIPQGEYAIEWDRSDAKGNPLSNGVYYLRLKTSNQENLQRLLIMR